MKEILAKIYEITPNFILNQISKSRILTRIKNILILENGNYKIIRTEISRSYHSFKVDFFFFGPIKIAIKAKKKGVENTLLRHSFKLLSEYKTDTDPTIYDVGANFGFLSMVWGKAFEKENGKVYAFEPSRKVSEVTKKSFKFNNLKNVDLQNKAIGNFSGHIDIYEGKASSNIKQQQNTHKINVEITKLDDFTLKKQIKNIDLIKIDVDGFELEVLKGAEIIIDKYAPILIVETNNDLEILDFIHSKDYVIFDMKLNKVIDLKSNISSNIFCVKPNN